MCIECVLRTSGGHTQQEQFWEDERRKRYGTSCPIPHSYQTWNCSYMDPFELIFKHIAEQKECEKHKERTHKHRMKFSTKSGFPHASNSNSPKQSHRRSSVSFSTPDEHAMQPQQEIAESTPKNEAAKIKEAETPPDPKKPRTQESTRSFNTSASSTPRPNTPSRNARSTKFATLDETARLQQ